MKPYIAGPMSGHESFNFPAFDNAAKRLRKWGHEPVSPAEIDDPKVRAACLASKHGGLADIPAGESYGAFLGRDIQIVIDDVDGVMVLPDWNTSRGARMEVFAAVQMGKPVYSFEGWDQISTFATVFGAETEEDIAGCRLSDEEISKGLGGGIAVLTAEVKQRPKDVVERAADALTEFWASAREPVEIRLGTDAQRAVKRAKARRISAPTLFGMNVTVDPRLAPDAVIVLGKGVGKTGYTSSLPLAEDDEILNDWIDKAIKFGRDMVASCRIDPLIRDLEFIPGMKARDGVTDPRKAIGERRKLKIAVDPGSMRAPWALWDEAPLKPSEADMQAARRTGGEVRTTSATGGQKGVKPERMDLIPPGFLEELGRVFGKGAEKYSDTNYLKGYEWRKSIGAGLRHWMKFLGGEDIDPETGCHHLAHAAWHCSTLFTYQAEGLGTDDRLFHAIDKSKRGDR